MVPEAATVSDDASRTIEIELSGADSEGWPVPVSLVAKKLDALQRAVLSLGTVIRHGGRSGTWRAEVAEACTLAFERAHHSNLCVTMSIPPPPTGRLALEDLGMEAVRRTFSVVDAVRRRDPETLARLLPDRGHRKRALNAVQGLLPEDEAEYSVALRGVGLNVTLGTDDRASLVEANSEDQGSAIQEPVTLTGKLYQIEVCTGERHIGIVVQNRKVRCHFPLEFEEIVSDLVPGSLVEVTGQATWNAAGGIEQIEEVTDAHPVELVPLSWSRVLYEHRRFTLRRRIQIQVEFVDGVWIHECPALRLMGYGSTRSESLRAIRLEFAASWDSIAMESDDALTPDAQELKRMFLALVEKAEDV